MAVSRTIPLLVGHEHSASLLPSNLSAARNFVVFARHSDVVLVDCRTGSVSTLAPIIHVTPDRVMQVCLLEVNCSLYACVLSTVGVEFWKFYDDSARPRLSDVVKVGEAFEEKSQDGSSGDSSLSYDFMRGAAVVAGESGMEVVVVGCSTGNLHVMSPDGSDPRDVLVCQGLILTVQLLDALSRRRATSLIEPEHVFIPFPPFCPFEIFSFMPPYRVMNDNCRLQVPRKAHRGAVSAIEALPSLGLVASADDCGQVFFKI
jgi:hypothetical protein